MRKKILTEQALYYGEVSMPKGFEIDSLNFSKSAFEALYTKKNSSYSKELDKLNTYIIEFIQLNYKFWLQNKSMSTNLYLPNEKDGPLTNVDFNDLKNASDFTLLYGINTVDCLIKIYYDDNRFKNKCHEIQLKQNMFVMFPSVCMYSIINNQKNNLNFIQTINYELK